MKIKNSMQLASIVFAMVGVIAGCAKKPAATDNAAADSVAFNPRDISGVWTRNPQWFDKSAAPCPECREELGGYDHR